MVLNWTIEVTLNFLSFLPYLLSSFFLLRQFVRHRDKILLLLVVTWFTYGLFWLTNGVAYLLLDKSIFQTNKILLVISSLCLVVAYDYMSREEIEPIKFSLFSIVCAALLYFSALPDAVSTIQLGGGMRSLQNTGSNRVLITLLALMVIIVYLYYSFKIYLHSSEPLKRYALLHLGGAVLFGPITLIFFLLEAGSYLPGITALISSFGVLLSSIAFARSPQLVYILPFRVSRLLVVESNSGVSIFSYSWQKEDKVISDQLFSTVLESLNIFTNEAINRGKIKSILLERGALLVQQVPQFNLFVVLVSSQVSGALTDNLKKFVQLFLQNFQHDLQSQKSNVKLVSAFKGADQLIDRAFPYIPRN